MVGLVLVSHSRTLVEGLRDIVAQFGGDEVPVALAGGTPDGRLGTTADRIATAIREVLGPAPASADGVVVLFDFGSAALSLEIALEELPLALLNYEVSVVLARKGTNAFQDDFPGGADSGRAYGTYSRNAHEWDVRSV